VANNSVLRKSNRREFKSSNIDKPMYRLKGVHSFWRS